MSNKDHDYKIHSGADFRKQRQGNGGSNATAEFESCADTEMTRVNWLWSNHLARGKLTMLAGDSALGKSQISINFTAALTKIGEWPDGDTAPRGSVIILSAEDAINDTIVPRLAAAGADLSRVHCLKCVRVQGKAQSFNIQTNMDLIAQKVREVGNVALVIIDPVTAYLGTKSTAIARPKSVPPCCRSSNSRHSSTLPCSASRTRRRRRARRRSISSPAAVHLPTLHG